MFDAATPHRAPNGWRFGTTNPTVAPAIWQVVDDSTAPSAPNCLALTKTDNYDGTFNLAMVDEPTLQDVELRAHVKAVAGTEDQGGGLIWRCQDENNYYICRFNPLESNFRVYVVAQGKRRQLDSVQVELSAGRWYEVRARMVGEQITCWLDGAHQLSATDGTIRDAGRVGLWTKADAVTSFDDLVAAPADGAGQVRTAPAATVPQQAGPTPIKLEAAETGMHNVLRVSQRIISGSAPESEADFVALRGMGVQTVLSVDGATPDIAGAGAAGLRYVHLPVGYHGIDPERRVELARAVRDLPGPVYVHCHHGVHRGPAAAAVAAVELGEMTAEEGVAFLHIAGTSENYRGLYACVAAAAVATPAELEAASTDFPAVAPRPGFVATMAQAQDAYDHLGAIRQAGWRVPEDHPDLVPPAEATRLAELMAGLLGEPEFGTRSAEFVVLLRESAARAREFEALLRANAASEKLSARLDAVGASCKACHVQYRDNR
jgi:cytochrome c556